MTGQRCFFLVLNVINLSASRTTSFAQPCISAVKTCFSYVVVAVTIDILQKNYNKMQSQAFDIQQKKLNVDYVSLCCEKQTCMELRRSYGSKRLLTTSVA